MTSNTAESFLSSNTPGESSARMAIDVRRLPWIRRLAADYAFDFPSVASFFAGNPSDRGAWADAIRRTQAHARRGHDIASVIAQQQTTRNAPARARDAARMLADAGTVAILTGQQAGLFGGPFFTLLKALTALKLAEQVGREHHVPAIAVFWVDGEDHDWDEVRSCTVLDEALTARTLSLPPRQGGDPAPVASVQLDASVTTVLDELERVLAPTEFRASLMADLRAIYVPGAGMADAFARWLERVLGDRGLVVYDSSDPASKPIAGGVFSRELSSPGETARFAASAGSELVARGYHAQVHGQDDGVALFHLDGSRKPIRHDGEQFVVGDRRYAGADLAKAAAENPAAFSPNVLLRPIVQDTVFPTICYVAGPNELAYLGQLRQVYERFGVPMPLMYARASVTLLDSAAIRFLQKHKVSLEALQPQDESALNQLLAAQLPAAVEESFSSAARSIETEMTRVREAVPAVDPTLEGAAKSTLDKMQHDLATLHNKMIQAAKRRDDTLRRQYHRTRALAFPNGHSQERTIGFVSFLNQYGPILPERLSEALPLDLGHHWVVAI